MRSVELLEGSSPAAIVRERLIGIGAEMGIEVDVAWGDDDEISLENIRVPDEKRRQGLATSFMKRLTDICDSHRVTCWVYPEPYEGEMGKSDLRTFYRDHGFQPVDDDQAYLVRRA